MKAVLTELASAAERYVQETEADAARMLDNRRRLHEAITDAWLLLRPEAGVCAESVPG